MTRKLISLVLATTAWTGCTLLYKYPSYDDPTSTCGDGQIALLEACDDGNVQSDDGCSDVCEQETGWVCGEGPLESCQSICGDGLRRGSEACDDGNSEDGDGCSPMCEIEEGFECADGMPGSTCMAICGDGLVRAEEVCDDGNDKDDDGCLSTDCTVRADWTCNDAEPSDCVPTEIPQGMVFVPGGTFLRGCAAGDVQCEADESPQREIYLSPYLIDASEVRVADYKGCDPVVCAEPGTDNKCTYKDNNADLDDHPINCVDWSQANAYCVWAKKRLSTEAEWEKAARGTDGFVYPWGNGPLSCAYAIMRFDGADGCGENSTRPAYSASAGNSVYGIVDMTGNVSEWVSDWYDADYYANSPKENPTGPAAGASHIHRGGSWKDDVNSGFLRSSSRQDSNGESSETIGFRCAMSAP